MCVEEVQWKKLCTAGLGGLSMLVDPWQEEGRVRGQAVERVNDMPASSFVILEDNCVATC